MTIFLLNKEVDLDKSELLLSLPFADASDLEQLELASGSWGIENGALVGRFRGNGGGIAPTQSPSIHRASHHSFTRNALLFWRHSRTAIAAAPSLGNQR